MPSATSKGVYIPEWVWKAMQSCLLAAVLGGYGMFYSMHGDVSELKLKLGAQEKALIELEAEVKVYDEDSDAIKQSLIAIETELPHIKNGIEELKTLMRSR